VNVGFSINILREHGNLVYYARIFTPELLHNVYKPDIFPESMEMNDKPCQPETDFNIEQHESERELRFQPKSLLAALPSEEITHLESLAKVPLGHRQNVPIASPGQNKIPSHCRKIRYGCLQNTATSF